METREQKKQIPLRLSKTLYAEINRWADDEFRSVNGQIEYLLAEAVKRRLRRPSADDSPGAVGVDDSPGAVGSGSDAGQSAVGG